MATRSWFVVATALVWFGGLLGSGTLTGCGPRLSLYQKGVEALRQKQYAEAIEWFSEELDDNPESHLALVNRGEAYFETRQLEQAIEDYTRAISLLERQQRPNPWFYNRRGLAYYRLGRYADAVVDWNRAKELEAERARTGVKVRRAPTYLSMSALRDTLLFDAERQAARAPEQAVASPHTPAPALPGAQEPESKPEIEAQAPSPSSEPALTAQTESESQPEPEVTSPETASVEEQSSPSSGASTPATTASAAKPVVARLGPEHELALEQARMTHEAAALELEAQERALKEAQRTAQRERERLAERERQRERQQQQTAAIAAARAEHEARARALAEQAARIQPVADLSGTWIRDDDYVFSLLDDGKRVIGTITDTEDFVFYEVTLEWTDNDTLTGFAVLKENLSPCRFETSTAWSLEVKEDGTLLAKIEEVGWNANCEENERTWGSYTFRRAK